MNENVEMNSKNITDIVHIVLNRIIGISFLWVLCNRHN